MSTRPKTVTIKIPLPTYCAQCMFCEVTSDPDPYDSFCADDEKMHCTKTRSKRCIEVGVRPYQVKKVKRPKWCPLIRKRS